MAGAAGKGSRAPPMQWTRFPSRRFIRSIRNHLAAPPQDPGSGILGARASRPLGHRGPSASWERGRPARSGPKVRGRRPATWQSGRGKAGVPPALVIPAISAPSFPRKRESRCPENPGRFTGHVGQVVVDTRFNARICQAFQADRGMAEITGLFTGSAHFHNSEQAETHHIAVHTWRVSDARSFSPPAPPRHRRDGRSCHCRCMDPHHRQAAASLDTALRRREPVLTHDYAAIESAALMQRRLGLRAALAFRRRTFVRAGSRDAPVRGGIPRSAAPVLRPPVA